MNEELKSVDDIDEMLLKDFNIEDSVDENSVEDFGNDSNDENSSSEEDNSDNSQQGNDESNNEDVSDQNNEDSDDNTDDGNSDSKHSVEDKKEFAFSKIRKENLPKLGVGQYLHWPPELLLENFEQCGRRIDYFSFGVTCYLIITGKYPYSNTERNVENVYHKYFEEYSQATELLKEHSKNLSISSDLLDFIIECLNPLVSERPQKWYRQDFILKKKSKI